MCTADPAVSLRPRHFEITAELTGVFSGQRSLMK
jgi:hypothetical protein